MTFKETYKKKIEPFIALGVFVMLLTLGFMLWQENKLEEEISLNCGFGEEDYYCYCEKNQVQQIEVFLNGTAEDPAYWENRNVSMVR